MEQKRMPYSEAQKRATIKYQKENYKSINMKFRLDEIEQLRLIASSKGMSPTAFCYEAVRGAMAKEQKDV